MHLTLLCHVLLLAILSLAAQKKGPSASLQGTIRDAQGRPVANASVLLKEKNSVQEKSASTDERGHYAFTVLSAGAYSVRAAKSGSGDGEISSVFLAEREDKTVDLVVSTAGAPQFFDEPQFSVSGVTDTTSLGGHGSDTLVRTRDSIAKDTTALSRSDAGPSEVAPEVDKSLRGGTMPKPETKYTGCSSGATQRRSIICSARSTKNSATLSMR